ncbi:MAG: 16S rRNA (guanine(527)-N(7))-methyltransferase RsmG [Chloroflexi bacterium]|nr:16S rRNA (guanine(527)-N(7))-methyltransferase RsmG [Chloroflexota bacterium]
MGTELSQDFYNLTGSTLTEQQSMAFDIYAHELQDWNRRYSLTAIRNSEKVRVKHYLDSLSAYLVMCNTPVESVVDVGTGAGFPGLPLKILWPHLQLTLVESVEKKVRFCEHIVDKLSLENVKILRDRAEVLGRQAQHRERYDWAVARAVAHMPVLMEYLLPFVRVGGRALAMKGETGPTEVHSAEQALRLLGGKLEQVTAVELPGVVEERYLVVINKIASTPDKYPRRAGIPSKRPL